MNLNFLIIANFYLLHSGGEQLIVLAMLLLFFVAIYFIVIEIYRYSRTEMQQLQQVKEKYEQIDKKRKNSHENFEILSDKYEKSIVYNRLKNIYFITHQGHRAFEKDLMENDKLTEEAKPNIVLIQNAHKILLLLAGLGICYEMMQMLPEAYLQKTNHITENENVITYLQTSFSLSFFALLLVTFLSVFKLVLQSYQQRFFAQLKQFTNNYLLPLFNPVKKQQQLEYLIAEVSENTKRMNQVSENLEHTSTLMTRDYESLRQTTGNIKTILIAFTTSQQHLHTDIAALTTIVEGYKKQYDTAREQHQYIVEGLNLHNLTIEKINGQLLNSELNMGDWIKQIIQLSHEQQDDFQQNLKMMLELSRSSLSSTQSASHRFNMSIAKFEKSLDLLYSHLEEFAHNGSQSTDKQLVKFSEFNSYLINLNHTMAQLQDDLPKQLEDILEYLKHGSETITEQRIKKLAANIAGKKTEKQLVEYKEKQLFLEEEVERLRQEIKQKWWTKILKKS
ncbi:MAG: hypothetical protein ACPG5B_09335 [Chitinophagales bacterium]